MSVLTPPTPARQVIDYHGPTPPFEARPKRRNLDKWLTHLGLLLLCTGFLLPVIWMLSTSLKTVEQTGQFPPQFIPNPLHAQNYSEVWNHKTFRFLLFARNTLIIAVLSVVGNCLSSSIVAYGFSKVRFKGRGVLFAVMLSTMMIPFPVMMVSLFTIFRWLGDHHMGQWLGTYKPLWVPAWFGSAFSIFLLRQFFMTIPDELSEAARIDGCSEFGIFWRVILPLAKPALVVVALFTFMAAWNDYLGPLVYVQDQNQYTLSLGLGAFQSQHGGPQNHYLMAASVLVIAPVIILFFLAQKTFIQGIATTGVKG